MTPRCGLSRTGLEVRLRLCYPATTDRACTGQNWLGRGIQLGNSSSDAQEKSPLHKQQVIPPSAATDFAT